MLLINAVLQYQRFRTLRAYRNGDWRTLPIKENNEPLVEVPDERCYPYYAKEMGLTADTRIFLRETLVEKYFKAARYLKERGEYELYVLDGWRSLEVQENLFWRYLKQYTAKNFNMQHLFDETNTSDQIRQCFLSLPDDVQVTLKEANTMYVSWPSSHLLKPSPHVTGGSIDVWLYQYGKPINLGVPFDYMEKEAGAFYQLDFLNKKKDELGEAVKRHRSLLVYAMVQAGFTCYGPEFWHFNHGNQMDSLVTKKMAKYSFVQL